MKVEEIAEKFIELYTSSDPFSKYQLYSEDCVSLERPQGKPSWSTEGLYKIKEKSKRFYKQFDDIVRKRISDPVISDVGFALRISIDYIDFKTKQQKTINEMCIFIIEAGKITREEFIYIPQSEEFLDTQDRPQ